MAWVKRVPDASGVPQTTVVGHAEQQRADGAGPRALAGPPAADDDLGVADAVIFGWQPKQRGRRSGG
jgi:hypothetical protein